MKDVKVMKIGLGEVTSNSGTYGGLPALFIEPLTPIREVGTKVPVADRNTVEVGGLVLQFHSRNGAEIVISNIMEALTQAGM